MKCSIEGCDALHKAKGFCDRHYRRLQRHGSATEVKYINSSVPLSWIENYVNYDADDCLKWPFRIRPDGYGVVGGRGRAHRIMCEKKRGKPSFEKAEAAHSCGNGHLGCVNPNHLFWKTAKENCDDKFIHGTLKIGSQCSWAIVNEEDVIEIRRMIKDGFKQKEIGEIFNLSQQTISEINTRKIWKHI